LTLKDNPFSTKYLGIDPAGPDLVWFDEVNCKYGPGYTRVAQIRSMQTRVTMQEKPAIQLPHVDVKTAWGRTSHEPNAAGKLAAAEVELDTLRDELFDKTEDLSTTRVELETQRRAAGDLASELVAVKQAHEATQRTADQLRAERDKLRLANDATQRTADQLRRELVAARNHRDAAQREAEGNARANVDLMALAWSLYCQTTEPTGSRQTPGFVVKQIDRGHDGLEAKVTMHVKQLRFDLPKIVVEMDTRRPEIVLKAMGIGYGAFLQEPR
jgi:hypothetical protein